MSQRNYPTVATDAYREGWDRIWGHREPCAVCGRPLLADVLAVTIRYRDPANPIRDRLDVAHEACA